MSFDETQIARLVHDVGKYITRTARNLPEGMIPATLVPLLKDDLFATDGEHTALELFDKLTSFERAPLADKRLRRCRELLVQIDGSKSLIERGDTESIRSAALLALRVDGLLREILAAQVGVLDD